MSVLSCNPGSICILLGFVAQAFRVGPATLFSACSFFFFFVVVVVSFASIDQQAFAVMSLTGAPTTPARQNFATTKMAISEDMVNLLTKPGSSYYEKSFAGNEALNIVDNDPVFTIVGMPPVNMQGLNFTPIMSSLNGWDGSTSVFHNPLELKRVSEELEKDKSLSDRTRDILMRDLAETGIQFKGVSVNTRTFAKFSDQQPITVQFAGTTYAAASYHDIQHGQFLQARILTQEQLKTIGKKVNQKKSIIADKNRLVYEPITQKSMLESLASRLHLYIDDFSVYSRWFGTLNRQSRGRTAFCENLARKSLMDFLVGMYTYQQEKALFNQIVKRPRGGDSEEKQTMANAWWVSQLATALGVIDATANQPAYGPHTPFHARVIADEPLRSTAILLRKVLLKRMYLSTQTPGWLSHVLGSHKAHMENHVTNPYLRKRGNTVMAEVDTNLDQGKLVQYQMTAFALQAASYAQASLDSAHSVVGKAISNAKVGEQVDFYLAPGFGLPFWS